LILITKKKFIRP